MPSATKAMTPTAPSPNSPREQNNAGGIEGGISNGEDIVVRGYLKPISTLRRPLGSVSFATREPVKAAYERSGRLRRPGRRSCRRGNGRAHYRPPRHRQVRRRFAARNPTKLQPAIANRFGPTSVEPFRKEKGVQEESIGHQAPQNSRSRQIPRSGARQAGRTDHRLRRHAAHPRR